MTITNKVKYFFDEESGILYKYHFGNINFDDIRISWDEAIRNNMIPDNVRGFILDYRNATFDMLPNEHMKIVNYYQQNLNTFGGHRIAILTEDPKDLVISVLVELKDRGYASKPFSTEEAAKKWLLM
jgi:hypothetical protein